MSASAPRAAARPVDWGGLAILPLLTLGIGAYASVTLGRRARRAVDAGWSGVRTQRASLLGLLCGIAGFVLAVLDRSTGWLAEVRGTGINWQLCTAAAQRRGGYFDARIHLRGAKPVGVGRGEQPIIRNKHTDLRWLAASGVISV